MSKNIVLCGVGGQGTILASKLISAAAMAQGLPVKSAETIGMAQRGGSVFSHIRIGEDAVSVVVSDAVVYMPLEDLVDREKEMERLKKEQDRLTKEIARCEGMLNNPNFVNKAPAAKVDAEKDKLAKYKEMMDKVKGQLEQLKK